MFMDTVQTGAATLARRAKKNPIELMVSLREGDPSGARDRILKRWVREIKSDDDYTNAALIYAAAVIWANVTRTSGQRKPRGRKTRILQLARDKADAVKRAQRIARGLLMNTVLSTGKMLRDATFKECAAEGGWLLAISKRGKPHQIVGETLKEKDLAGLRS